MNIDSALAWMYDRKSKVTYSMAYRNGPSSYDCSSSVYYSLVQGGYLPSSIRIGNTDSLYGDLERNGWTKVGENKDGSIDAQRGDVFLWGVRGQSSGGAGHTGFFINSNDIIHCAYGYNGIAITNHDWLWELNGRPKVTIYRKTSNAIVAPNPVDQVLEVGSLVQFSKVYRADDVQFIGGHWQVRTNELCRADFTWEDNGIPAEPVVEVDTEGYRTSDQELDIGSLYIIPGKYRVLDIEQVSGMWLGQFDFNGLKFWADVESTTEIPDSDPGKAQPIPRPVTPPTPPSSTPEIPVVVPPVIVAPPVIVPPTPKPDPIPEVPVDEETRNSSIWAAIESFFKWLSKKIKGDK